MDQIEVTKQLSSIRRVLILHTIVTFGCFSVLIFMVMTFFGLTSKDLRSKPSVPVRIVNLPIEIEVPSYSPIPVEIDNEPIEIEVPSYSPIPVEIDNEPVSVEIDNEPVEIEASPYSPIPVDIQD